MRILKILLKELYVALRISDYFTLLCVKYYTNTNNGKVESFIKDFFLGFFNKENELIHKNI